jgi:hypothetical protein
MTNRGTGEGAEPNDRERSAEIESNKEVLVLMPAVPIAGQVAELLTERDLVINRGADHGVSAGDRFKIINPRGTQIRDPETNELLGSVELVKVIVKVVSVQQKLSVARTFKTLDVAATGFLGLSAHSLANVAASLGTPGGSRVETLRSDEKFAQEDMDESQSYVKRGDPAVQIVSNAGGDY